MLEAKIYVLWCESESTLKVGVSRKDIKERLDSLKRECESLDFICIFEEWLPSSVAYRIEKKILHTLRSKHKTTTHKFSGSTECFVVCGYEDVVEFVKSETQKQKQSITNDKNNADLLCDDLIIPSWLLKIRCVYSETEENNQLVLTPFHKMVYSFIVQYKEVQQKDVARSLGVSVSIVEKSVRKLVSAGMLKVSTKQICGAVKLNSYSCIEDFDILE